MFVVVGPCAGRGACGAVGAPARGAADGSRGPGFGRVLARSSIRYSHHVTKTRGDPVKSIVKCPWDFQQTFSVPLLSE